MAAEYTALPATLLTSELRVRAAMPPGTAMLRRAAGLVMDVLMLLAVVLSIPAVILAVGIPIALAVQLVLRILRYL